MWPSATAPTPVIGAVAEARNIIKAIRELYGLDRELGDAERPLTTQETVEIDHSDLSNEELRILLALAERQAAARGNGVAHVA